MSLTLHNELGLGIKKKKTKNKPHVHNTHNYHILNNGWTKDQVHKTNLLLYLNCVYLFFMLYILKIGIVNVGIKDIIKIEKESIIFVSCTIKTRCFDLNENCYI